MEAETVGGLNMPEQVSVVDMLRNLKFSVLALAELVPAEQGSYGKEQAKQMAKGITVDIDWCLEKLRQNGYDR